jgi:hypothetical protein
LSTSVQKNLAPAPRRPFSAAGDQRVDLAGVQAGFREQVHGVRDLAELSLCELLACRVFRERGLRDRGQ